MMKSLISGCSRCGCWLLLTLALVLAILIALIVLVQRAVAQTPEPELIPLVPPLEARRSIGPLPHTFYEREISVSYCGGRVWLVGAPDLKSHPIRTDDEVVISSISGGEDGAETRRELSLNFQSPDRSRIIARPGPVDVTALFPPRLSQKGEEKVHLRVRLVDYTPPEYSSGPYWLVLERRCAPAPTPTMQARATPGASVIPASPVPMAVTSRPATPTQAAPTLAPPVPRLSREPADLDVEPPGLTDTPGLGPVAATLLGAGLIVTGIAWIVRGKRSGSARPLNLYLSGIVDLLDRETLQAHTVLLYQYPQGVIIAHRPLRVVALTAALPQNALARILPSVEGAVLEEVPPGGQPAPAPVPLAPGRSYSLAGGHVALHYRNPLQIHYR